jgi:hypothetical protein
MTSATTPRTQTWTLRVLLVDDEVLARLALR